MPITDALKAVKISEVSSSELRKSDFFAFNLISTCFGGLNGQSCVRKNDGPLSQGLSRSELAETQRVPASAGLAASLDLT